MNKTTLIGLLILPTALMACKNKQDASAENFLQALNTTGRGQNIDVCVSHSDKWNQRFSKWLEVPYSVKAGKLREHETQLEALVGAGILRVSGTTAVRETDEGYSDTGNKVDVKNYEVTDVGKKFYLNFGDSSDLCYTKAIPAVIVKWEGPMQRGSHEVVDVTFKRRVGEIADWAAREPIRDVFSVKQAVHDVQDMESTATLKRTSEGWEAL
jgi:hypothetical protein